MTAPRRQNVPPQEAPLPCVRSAPAGLAGSFEGGERVPSLKREPSSDYWHYGGALTQ